MTQHPAIAALLNAREEMNRKLSRAGATALQELLQPLWDSDTPISAISWDQSRDGTTNAFFSTHRIPRVLVDRALMNEEYGKHRYVDPTKVVGVLGAGWTYPKELIPAARKLYEEKILLFAAIPNDVMQLIFGDNATVNIERSGRITTGNMR